MRFIVFILFLMVLVALAGCTTVVTKKIRGRPYTCLIKVSEGTLAVINFDDTTYDEAMKDTETIIGRLTLDGLLKQDATGECRAQNN